MSGIAARRLVVALLAVFGASAAGLAIAGPRYRRHKLHELVARADLVVAGEIVCLDQGGVFELMVETAIAGDSAAGTLRVARFQDWTCAGRWTEYEVGQRVLLFLRRPDDGKSPLGILGGGGEGEMPLAGDSAVVRGYAVRGYETRQHEVKGAVCVGPLVPLAEIAESVRTFRDAFTWGEKDGLPIEWFDYRSEELAQRLRASSRFGGQLWEEVESSPGWTHRLQKAPFPMDAKSVAGEAHGLSGPARLAPGAHPDRFGFNLITRFASACAYVGDVDGNGHLDLAAGAPGDSRHGDRRGTLWILLMDRGGELLRVAEVGAASAGSAARGFGSSVAALGDLDRDGVPDLLIGAMDGDAGAVSVLYLHRGGGVARSVDLDVQECLRAAGLGPGFTSGHSVANLGDLDADGSPEIAVGAYRPFDLKGLLEGEDAEHCVLIASLDRDGRVRWTRFFGEHEAGSSSPRFSLFGAALVGLGDVDGDQVPDLAVGDPFDDDGGDQRGALWIVNLHADGSVKSRRKVSDWEGGFDGLLRDDERLGTSLASPGDLDGDGVPDLIAGGTAGIWLFLLNRDGTVKHHAAWAAGTDSAQIGDLGVSLACAQPHSGEPSAPLLAVAGSIAGHEAKLDGVIWLLSLRRDGVLESQ